MEKMMFALSLGFAGLILATFAAVYLGISAATAL